MYLFLVRGVFVVHCCSFILSTIISSVFTAPNVPDSITHAFFIAQKCAGQSVGQDKMDRYEVRYEIIHTLAVEIG